jgi:hypothetical protein
MACSQSEGLNKDDNSCRRDTERTGGMQISFNDKWEQHSSTEDVMIYEEE